MIGIDPVEYSSVSKFLGDVESGWKVKELEYAFGQPNT